jgi:DNA-binding winged helix-turn-helix (wHTH) protein
MATLIECINKNNRSSPHERIENVGGRGWKITESSAIQNIRNGERYAVEINGRRIGVVVAEHEGRPYLKTEADGYAPNNLLSLPECP